MLIKHGFQEAIRHFKILLLKHSLIMKQPLYSIKHPISLLHSMEQSLSLLCSMEQPLSLLYSADPYNEKNKDWKVYEMYPIKKCQCVHLNTDMHYQSKRNM